MVVCIKIYNEQMNELFKDGSTAVPITKDGLLGFANVKQADDGDFLLDKKKYNDMLDRFAGWPDVYGTDAQPIADLYKYLFAYPEFVVKKQNDPWLYAHIVETLFEDWWPKRGDVSMFVGKCPSVHDIVGLRKWSKKYDPSMNKRVDRVYELLRLDRRAMMRRAYEAYKKETILS